MAKRLKSPGFKLYIESFLHGTKSMTAEQVGGYILLLCHQWDDGYIPADLNELKLLAKTDENNLKIILRKFEKKKSGFVNIRLEVERSKQKENAKRNKTNGLKGGRPKKKENPKQTQRVNLNNPENNPSYSNSISTNISKDILVNTPSQKLVDFISKTRKVSKLAYQLTIEEADKLLTKYPKDLLLEKIAGMENKKDLLKKYESVYLTLNGWCRMALEKIADKANNGQGVNTTGITANP